MSKEKSPKSLFLKTSLTLALGLVIYTALTIVLVFHFILSPMANRAAEDMAAFIAMVSESWSYLSVEERVQLQQHLREQHQLFITSEPVAVTEILTPLYHGWKKHCCGILGNTLLSNKIKKAGVVFGLICRQVNKWCVSVFFIHA